MVAAFGLPIVVNLWLAGRSEFEEPNQGFSSLRAIEQRTVTQLLDKLARRMINSVKLSPDHVLAKVGPPIFPGHR